MKTLYYSHNSQFRIWSHITNSDKFSEHRSMKQNSAFLFLLNYIVRISY